MSFVQAPSTESLLYPFQSDRYTIGFRPQGHELGILSLVFQVDGDDQFLIHSGLSDTDLAGLMKLHAYIRFKLPNSVPRSALSQLFPLPYSSLLIEAQERLPGLSLYRLPPGERASLLILLLQYLQVRETTMQALRHESYSPQ